MIETIVIVVAGLACLAFVVAVPGVPILAVWLRRNSYDDRSHDLADQLMSGYLTGMFLLALFTAAAMFLPVYPFSILVLALGLFIGVMTLCERYGTQRVVFVRALAAAAEREIPLAPLARAMARESGLLYRRRLRRFAQHLESGATLLDAVQSVRGLLPDSAVVAIVTGTLSGRLAPPLREVADAHVFERPIWRGVAMGAVYLFALLSLAFLYMQGMVVFVFPHFRQIADAFNMPPTTSWNWVPAAAHSTWAIVASMLIFVLLAGLFFLSLLLSLGVIRWSFGPLARLRRRVDVALVMRSLAAMAEVNKPFGPLLAALATGFPSSWARPRLENAAQQISIGGDWCVALESQGLIGPSDAAVIQAGQRVGNLPWVLRELATSSERRFVYRVAALGQVLLPLAVILCGLVVLAIVVVCFRPLVEIIGGLT